MKFEVEISDEILNDLVKEMYSYTKDWVSSYTFQTSTHKEPLCDCGDIEFTTERGDKYLLTRSLLREGLRRLTSFSPAQFGSVLQWDVTPCIGDLVLQLAFFGEALYDE